MNHVMRQVIPFGYIKLSFKRTCAVSHSLSESSSNSIIIVCINSEGSGETVLMHLSIFAVALHRPIFQCWPFDSWDISFGLLSDVQ